MCRRGVELSASRRSATAPVRFTMSDPCQVSPVQAALVKSEGDGPSPPLMRPTVLILGRRPSADTSSPLPVLGGPPGSVGGTGSTGLKMSSCQAIWPTVKLAVGHQVTAWRHACQPLSSRVCTAIRSAATLPLTHAGYRGAQPSSTRSRRSGHDRARARTCSLRRAGIGRS